MTLENNKDLEFKRKSGFKKKAGPPKSVLNIRVEAELLQQVKNYCKERDITLGSFAEVALRDAIEKY